MSNNQTNICIDSEAVTADTRINVNSPLDSMIRAVRFAAFGNLPDVPEVTSWDATGGQAGIATADIESYRGDSAVTKGRVESQLKLRERAARCAEAVAEFLRFAAHDCDSFSATIPSGAQTVTELRRRAEVCMKWNAAIMQTDTRLSAVPAVFTDGVYVAESSDASYRKHMQESHAETLKDLYERRINYGSADTDNFKWSDALEVLTDPSSYGVIFTFHSEYDLEHGGSEDNFHLAGDSVHFSDVGQGHRLDYLFTKISDALFAIDAEHTVTSCRLEDEGEIHMCVDFSPSEGVDMELPGNLHLNRKHGAVAAEVRIMSNWSGAKAEAFAWCFDALGGVQ